MYKVEFRDECERQSSLVFQLKLNDIEMDREKKMRGSREKNKK